MASRSATVTGAITSSLILLLQQLDLGLGEPDVDRRDVAIAEPLTALLDLDGPPRAAKGDVVVLNEVGDADHAAFRELAEVRRRFFAGVVEGRDIQLAA